jgi:hypothetical protein
MEFQAFDFAGQTYDSGMAPEVLEIQEDASAIGGDTIVSDTIAPTLTWRGQVVSAGQVVLKRLPGPTEQTLPGTND